MSNYCSLSPSVTSTLLAGSTTSPFAVDVQINQKLCKFVCTDGHTPVFNPTFSLVEYQNVSGTNYVATINVQGRIDYIPINGSPCNPQSMLVNVNFPIYFVSATAPTAVDISLINTDNSMIPSTSTTGCACYRSRHFLSDNVLTLTVTTA